MRNCSYIFGTKTTRPFLEKGKYISIIRDPQLEGFKMHQQDKNIDFPFVIIIFSAPNYCDVYGNKATYIRIKKLYLLFNNIIIPHNLQVKA